MDFPILLLQRTLKKKYFVRVAAPGYALAAAMR
jgi:hypothetical protein